MKWAAMLALVSTGCFFLPERHPTGGGDDGGTGDAISIPPNTNVMFVTSTTMPLWPGGPPGDGVLVTADAKCKAIANDAGLPGDFVAWLSSSTSPAATRLAGASGWVRTDGRPFANAIGGAIYYPPVLDESGHRVDLDASGNELLAMPLVATGTTSAGVATTANCWAFTNFSSAKIDGGWANAGTTTWTDAASAVNCYEDVRWYCFQKDFVADVAPPPPPPSAKLAFVTRGNQFASTGGFAEADHQCTLEAQAFGHNKQTKALIAGTTASPKQRVEAALVDSGPWFRPDGVIVSADLSRLEAPINQTLDLSYTDNKLVWVGSKAIDRTGTVTSTCNEWTDPGPASLPSRANLIRLDDLGTEVSCAEPMSVLCVDVN